MQGSGADKDRDAPWRSYPQKDEMPYLDWAGPHFSSVFVAFNPFVRRRALPNGGCGLSAGAPDWEAAVLDAGPACSMGWAEVAARCGFASAAEVNHALRHTGSDRLVDRLRDPERAAALRRLAMAEALDPPDEGCIEPQTALPLFAFLQALGVARVRILDCFGDQGGLVEAASPRDLSQLGGFVAEDLSLRGVVYTDYHYMLIAQTADSLRRAAPQDFFEGFFAAPGTCDLWWAPGAA